MPREVTNPKPRTPPERAEQLSSWELEALRHCIFAHHQNRKPRTLAYKLGVSAALLHAEIRALKDGGVLAQTSSKIRERTLCYACAKASLGSLGCCWAAAFQPVPGWDAIETVSWSSVYCATSYLVKSCPEFLHDGKSEL